MKTQQTALEWFSDKTWRLKVQLENKEITIGEYGVTYVEIFEQAKEIEKERIISAQMDMFHFLNNLKFGMMYIEKREEAEKFAEQWYNETF